MTDLSSTPKLLNLHPAEQIDYIDTLKDEPMQAGETWYLVSMIWVSRWKQYCRRSLGLTSNQEVASQLLPGPVNNKSLLDDEYKLLPDLVEDIHYICVPEIAWCHLENWYGVSETNLPRQVITDGAFVHANLLEVYPPTFKVYLIPATQDLISSTAIITLSRKTSVYRLKQVLLNVLDLDQGMEFELKWLPNDDDTVLVTLQDAKLINIDDDKKTISDLQLTGGTLAMIVYTHYDNFIESLSSSSPLSTSSVTCNFGTGFKMNSRLLSSSSPYSSYLNVFDYNDYDKDFSNPYDINDSPFMQQQSNGLCGLDNLGNTCFMNSALQCLSNTKQLTQWVLDGKYKEELNRDNLLGMNGEIAEEYGLLIQKLWNGTAASIDATDFKKTIGRFSSLFNGNQQHDSQELLAFLLDGLHEDTNRILKKPYIELPDFDDMTDEQIAEASWDYYKARNDSIIVDLFQGQFKSRLVCNTCQKVSVTFDPFMYLSLPLPRQKKCNIDIVYIPYDPSIIPQTMTITLDNNACFEHFKVAVANRVDVDDPSTLIILEIYNNKIYKVYKDYEPVGSTELTDTIYVYEVPHSLSPSKKHSLKSPLPLDASSSSSDTGDNDNNNKDSNGEQWIVFPVYCSSSFKQFGIPFLLSVQVKDLYQPENLYRLIAMHLERYTSKKVSEEVCLKQAVRDPLLPISPTSPIKTNYNDCKNQPQPMRTTVVASGSRYLEPINNLFSIKIFVGDYYDGDPDNSIPANNTSWRSAAICDIMDRFAREHDGTRETRTTVAEKDGNSPDTMGHSEPTSSAATYDLDYVFSDMANLDSVFSLEQQSKSSLTTIQQPSPSLSPAAAPLYTPQTLIRQGEGILLDWAPKDAQEFFATDDEEYMWTELDAVPASNDASDDNNKEHTLMQCLDEFTKKEHLSEEDLWYCPQCEQHQRATKKFDLWRLPEILVIHLKRFGHTPLARDKVDALIDFPLDALDMTDRVLGLDHCVAPEDRFVYDLYAVDNHMGGTGGGHCN
ncbi:hypothetical protein BC941DRAFT_428297 [Chlamydoabsidia padenii]|nr:hypothetical protein BC941DRAFT_428297 [Chlamydoabsidia padenii]